MVLQVLSYTLTVLILILVLPAESAPLNTTALLPDLPPGFSNHGDLHLLCRPAKWTDVAIFYLGNFIAHAATIRSLPGESPLGVAITIVVALLFPTSGVIRGFKAIQSLAIFRKSDLCRAARAGALCTMIRRAEEKPKPIVRKDSVLQRLFRVRGPRNRKLLTPKASISLTLSASIALLSTKIHGHCVPPTGYELVTVQGDATFENDRVEEGPWYRQSFRQIRNQFRPVPTRNTVIACNYNAVKVIGALAQLLFAIATLYRSRGDQINRYGFAAFGLTVTPYAFMSVVNLVGNLMCPEYPAMYLIESKAMRDRRDEAERSRRIQKCSNNAKTSKLASEATQEPEIKHNQAQRPRHAEDNIEEVKNDIQISSPESEPDNFYYEGTVGRLDKKSEKLLEERMAAFRRPKNVTRIVLRAYIHIAFRIVIASAVPLAVIGGLSRFRTGSSSTRTQRQFIELWLSLGVVAGVVMEQYQNYLENRTWLNVRRVSAVLVWSSWIINLLYGVPAVIGFVIVGKMMYEYGVCVRINT